MFRLQPVAVEPWNCPYCPYAPVSHSDLTEHLRMHSAPAPRQCAAENCGFMYIDKWEYMEHVVHTHSHKDVESLDGEEGTVGRLLASTYQFLRKMKKLKHEDEDSDQPAKLEVEALLLHSISLLTTTALPRTAHSQNCATSARKLGRKALRRALGEVAPLRKRRKADTSSKISTSSSPRSKESEVFTFSSDEKLETPREL